MMLGSEYCRASLVGWIPDTRGSGGSEILMVQPEAGRTLMEAVMRMIKTLERMGYTKMDRLDVYVED